MSVSNLSMTDQKCKCKRAKMPNNTRAFEDVDLKNKNELEFDRWKELLLLTQSLFRQGKKRERCE